LTLVRDPIVREPNMLITSLATWCHYAANAPLVRLQRWSFAVNDRGEALIRGLPLPPLAGRRFVEQDGVAVEAGWTWSPNVSAAVLRRKVQVTGGDLLLLHGEPLAVEVVPAAAFVKATRSAARQTLAGAVR
jgi:hypothetical protein